MINFFWKAETDKPNIAMTTQWHTLMTAAVRVQKPSMFIQVIDIWTMKSQE